MTTWMENDIESNFLCLDCGKDTRICVEPGDYYMLHYNLWEAITTPQERRGMLCIACASTRLGRQFTDDDFLTSPVQMVARLLAIRVTEETDEQKRRVLDTFEERGLFPQEMVYALLGIRLAEMTVEQRRHFLDVCEERVAEGGVSAFVEHLFFGQCEYR